MAEDISELLISLKIERAICVGISMGGDDLLNLFTRIPDKFAAFVLCSTTAEADSSEKRLQRLDLINKIEINGMQTIIDEMLPDLLSKTTGQNNFHLCKEIEKMISEANPKAAVAVLRGMSERKSLIHLLPDISLPVYLIFGKEDLATTQDIAHGLNQQISNSNFFSPKTPGITSIWNNLKYLTKFLRMPYGK